MSIADMVTAARPADPATPGSDGWKRRCTASKIAPILGVSPWESRYEVWHTLAGHPMPDETTYAMLRGTHLEQGVIDLWHALNPDWEVEETGDWQSIDREWLFARPDGLLLDPVSHRVSANGRAVEMGPTEYRLLQFFMTHQERAYTRSQLLDQVWGGNVYVEERTVDVHIRRLRKALGETHQHLIQTVRGTGYRFSSKV